MQFFLRLQTQWILAPSGHRTGLNYASLPIVADLLDLELTPEIFGDLQLMEITTRNELMRDANG